MSNMFDLYKMQIVSTNDDNTNSSPKCHIYLWRINPKIHNVQKTKVNGALIRENQNANNKSVEKA